MNDDTQIIRAFDPAGDDTQIITAVPGPDDTTILGRLFDTRPVVPEVDASMRMATAGHIATDQPSVVTARPGPRGFYEALIATARTEASHSNRLRLDELDSLLADTPNLWDEPIIDVGAGQLVNSRIAFASHLVTGPALLSLHSRLEPADQIPGELIDACTDWLRFTAHPALRIAAVEVLARNPVPALLRLTLIDVARMASAGRWDTLIGSVISAVSQISRIDAIGSETAVQVAVACLLPPGRLPCEENDAPGGMRTLGW